MELPLGKAHFSPAELNGGNTPDVVAGVEYPAGTRQKPASISMSNDAPASAPKLLLAEDMVDMRNFIASLLIPAYQFIEAVNGRIALDIIHNEHIDLVISDIMMPEMDGLMMLGQIRQQEATRHLPVLLLTARAADEDRIIALWARADDYLAKPFDAEELQLRGRNLLARSNP